MNEPLIKIELTNEEILTLDGKVHDKAQEVVDDVKFKLKIKEETDLSDAEAKLVQEVISEAKSNKKLVYRNLSIRYCGVCKKKGGYYIYKKGRNKGRPNIDRPLYIRGVDFASRSITVSNYATIGACIECIKRALPHIKEGLKGIDCELPESLAATDKKFKRYPNYECTECGWAGHEGQLGMLPAMMGGHYHGQCPKCKAANKFLGPTYLKVVSGYTIVEQKGKK